MRSLLKALAPLALAPTLVAAADDGTMARVVDNVRVNEELYKNIEIISDHNYKYIESRWSKPTFLKSNEGVFRCVLQNDMIYCKDDAMQARLDGKSRRGSVASGYDGVRTRLADYGGNWANINDQKLVYPIIHRVNPFTILLRRQRLTFPLHVWIGGEAEISKQKSYLSRYHYRVESSGKDVVDGLPCLKVRIEWRGEQTPPGKEARGELWLAPDRNYIPVKWELYDLAISSDHPMDSSHSEDFRELAPGVWYPFRSTILQYDQYAYAEDRKLVLVSSEEYTAEKVELDPHYDLGLFRDIPIPNGMVVYEIHDGQVTKGYVQGGKPKPEAEKNRLWLILAAGLVAVLIGVVSSRKRLYALTQRFRQRVPV
jgi:hypothetical protein